MYMYMHIYIYIYIYIRMVWLCRLGLVETLNPKPHAPRAALSSYIMVMLDSSSLGRGSGVSIGDASPGAVIVGCRV